MSSTATRLRSLPPHPPFRFRAHKFLGGQLSSVIQHYWHSLFPDNLPLSQIYLWVNMSVWGAAAGFARQRTIRVHNGILDIVF